MKKVIASLLLFSSLVAAQMRAPRPMFRYQVYPRPIVVHRPYTPIWPYVVAAPLGGIIGYEIGVRHEKGHVIECKDFPITINLNGVEQIANVKECRVDNGPWQIPSSN